MIIRRRIYALAPLSLLAACGSGMDPDAVLETVRATEEAQLQAIAARDHRGAVRNYHEGAVVVFPGRTPNAGAGQVEDAFEHLLSDSNFALEVEPGTAWAADSGDLAVTTYRARLTSTDAASGKPVTVPIVNQTVWRRDAGEPWKIVSDHNAVLPAA